MKDDKIKEGDIIKHVFILNPHSGKKGSHELVISQINELASLHKYDITIYKSGSREECDKYIKETCESTSDDILFYACGGDGTINSVASSIVDIPNALLTVVPCGSGNDYIKVFGGKDKFLNISSLMNGKEIKVDIMKVNEYYSINVANFGFDASVCDVANKVRRKWIIGGRNSYKTGILVSLFKARKNKCRVTVDDTLLIDSKILLSTIANGKYVGGAYCCAPYSNPSDGLLDIAYVKPLRLTKFLKMVGSYKKGTHLENPKYKDLIIHLRGKKATIDAPKGFKICLDGEIYYGEHFEIENLKQKIRFIIPE